MLKSFVEKHPFISGVVVGVIGVRMLGRYLKKKLSNCVIVITEVNDEGIFHPSTEEPATPGGENKPPKPKIEN